MKALPIAVVVTFLSSGAIAQQVSVGVGQILQFGAGINSCATWLQNAVYEQAGMNWLLGYWTGLNESGILSGMQATGNSTDTNGIVAEVKKTCAARPSMSLREATHTTYMDFVVTKR